MSDNGQALRAVEAMPPVKRIVNVMAVAVLLDDPKLLPDDLAGRLRAYQQQLDSDYGYGIVDQSENIVTGLDGELDAMHKGIGSDQRTKSALTRTIPKLAEARMLIQDAERYIRDLWPPAHTDRSDDD